MKIILTTLFLLSLSTVNSQQSKVKISPDFPISDLIYDPVSLLYDSLSFFHYGKMFFFSNNLEYTQHTIVVDLATESSQFFVQKKLEVGDYIACVGENKKFFDGDYLYDFVKLIHKKNFGHQSYAVLKRNINSIDKVEQVLMFEHIITVEKGPGAFIHNNVTISFYPGKSCFYIVRRASVGESGNQNYISKYNYDFEEEWTKDFSITNQTSVNGVHVLVNDNDDLLVALTVSGELKPRESFKATELTARTSGLVFYILDEKGNELLISPEIDRKMQIRHFGLRYYPKQKEVVGFFMLSNPGEEYTTSRNGYTYMKWNSEGSILTSDSKFFSVEDFTSDELNSFLSVQNKDYNEFLNKDGGLETLNFFKTHLVIDFNENQEVVFAGTELYKLHVNNFKKAPVNSVRGCQLVYKIDNDGGLDWLNFVPAKTSYGKPYYYQNNVYLFKSDFIENFSNGKHSFANDKGTATLSVQKINVETGETESFEPIYTIGKNDIINSNIRFENEKFVIQIRNPKKKTRKVLIYEL